MMVGNESHIINRVLESCYRHIDYWIIQCNGSDNTQQLVEEFFKEKDIPGYCYNVEWQYPGWNSDHLIQECYRADHNCDWFFRIDADEQLQVDDDFDWSVLDDTSIQSWDVVATNEGASWFRNRIWNSKLPWRFKHDKRHECIILPGCGPTEEEFQRVSLDKKFRHYIQSDGNSYVSPTKFLVDALELEIQHLANNTLLSDLYHFFYVGKSYYDCYRNEFPLGYEHQKEYARRCIFYCQKFVEYVNIQDEMVYYAQYLVGNSYRFCGEFDKAIEAYERASHYCPKRNEHLCGLAELYWELNDYESMFIHTKKLMDPSRKNPFPELAFLIHNTAYYDTGNYVKQLHDVALQNLSA
jgi:tetratricopeptide (TPR) repeat protein